jgi:hypothetical protein
MLLWLQLAKQVIKQKSPANWPGFFNELTPRGCLVLSKALHEYMLAIAGAHQVEAGG